MAKEICPRLVNGGKCEDVVCRSTRNHKPSAVNHWIVTQKSKPCRHDWPCWNFEQDLCLFYHPADEEKFEDQRRKLMVADLVAPVTIDLPVTLAGADGEEPVNVNLGGAVELSSFNRITASEIAIPGEPSFFKPPTITLEFKMDTPENEARPYLKYRHDFEPLLRSIESICPDLNFEDVNLVVNTGSLRRLLHYMGDSASFFHAERFDLQWQADTLFIARWADDPQRKVSAGFGSGFQRATCTFARGLEDSISHHRVLSYRLGSLQCVVQSEVDGYSCDCHPPPLPPKSEDLNHAFEQLRVTVPEGSKGDELSSSAEKDPVPLKIRQAGREIPASCLMELKTRNPRNPPRFEAEMYFAQRNRLYEALHLKGMFCSTGSEIEDKWEHLEEWEKVNQENLGRVVKFLEALIAAVGDHAKDGGEKHTALVIETHDGEPRASLYDRTDGRSLIPESFGKSMHVF